MTEKQIEEHECKNCENFDISANTCLIDNSKGYNKGTPLHEDCEKYKEVHWRPM